MAIVTEAELLKKKEELDKHLSKLLDPSTGKQKGKALVTMVRGAIRSSFSISPVKLAYYEMGRKPDLDHTTATKWKMQCELCNEWFKVDLLEIDHIEGNHSFTEPEHFESYYDNILDVEFKDLQRICKYKCHRIKSHKESKGFPDMKSACIDKIIIFLVKFVPTVELTKLLTALKVQPESSAPKRKKQLSSWLIEQDLDYDTLSHLFESCDYIMRLEAKRKKAKKFNLSKVDLSHLVKWKSFWHKYDVVPVTTLKVLD
tara:strand:+ start:1007 stop:1780 length:774 start_codon:yes stop_codon:yes gene_type:complete